MKNIILLSILILLLSCSGKIMEPDQQVRPATIIRFQVSEDCHVKLEILDSRMEEVNLLCNSIFVTGYYSVVWNGRDEDDRNCPSGVYYARLRTESSSEIIAMLMLK